MLPGSLTPSQKRFVSLLSTAWFPAHPAVVARVRARVIDDELVRDRAALEKELLQDPSLFIRTVRELSIRAHQLASNGTNEASVENLMPSSLIRNASVDLLRELLDVPPDVATAVPFHAASPGAAKRTLCAMFASVSAHILEDKGGEYATLGSAAGMFRQLGMLLISWHHPHVYERILANLAPTESADEAFARVLGMSPTALGLVLSREWRISPHLRVAMGDDLPEESEEVRRVGLRLRKFCELGERLAHGQFMSKGGSGLTEYRDALTQVQLILGADGLKTLLNNVDAASLHLKKSFPSLFPDLTEARKPQVVVAPAPVFKALPSFVKDQIEFLRDRFQSGVAPEQIRNVIEQLIRSIGFARGSLFLLEPVQQQLIPRLAWGDLNLRNVRPLSLALGAASVGSDTNGDKAASIVRAFKSGSMVRAGKGVIHFAAPIGLTSTIGVIVFEMDKDFLASREEVVTESVAAIARAVSDVLGL